MFDCEGADRGGKVVRASPAGRCSTVATACNYALIDMRCAARNHQRCAIRIAGTFNNCSSLVCKQCTKRMMDTTILHVCAPVTLLVTPGGKSGRQGCGGQAGRGVAGHGAVCARAAKGGCREHRKVHSGPEKEQVRTTRPHPTPQNKGRVYARPYICNARRARCQELLAALMAVCITAATSHLFPPRCRFALMPRPCLCFLCAGKSSLATSARRWGVAITWRRR
jgi:hypothetical protein